MSGLRTAVVGLDGAHFELLEPWIEAGKLPNIERIIETGVSSDLKSVMPPVTSPNWKAYATGKNPGKIGIFWWENIDTDARRVYYPTHRKSQNTEYWELLAEDDPVGVLGVPTTYPPKTLQNGFLVAGAPDGENTDFATPPSVEQELREQFDYRVLLSCRLKDYRERAAEEIIDLIDLRFRAAKQLAKEHDVHFLQVSTFYINSLHHYLWDDEYTLRAWQTIDEHVGDITEIADNVVLMSDHGSNPIHTVFHINTWLEEQGYLSLATGSGNALYRLGINTDRLVRLATRLRIREPAERLAPQWLLNRIPNEHGEFKREQKTEMIDWENTDVIASGQGPIYLTLDRDDEDYESIRRAIIERIESLTSPAGNPVADAVYCGEEVYEGEYTEEAPDLVIDQAHGVHIPGNIGSDDVFTDPKSGWRAENKREGLFAASGPAFGRGSPEPLSILDLAPTLLHLYGHAVPDDMDGTVRADVFAEDSDAATRSVEYTQRDSKDTEIDRIRSVARRIATESANL
ncbi:alkaline phosphatase family protein [Halapricum salinum]|uniref:Nucleotide pyrophosphatase n=1 Tax=Halapricum salinum TaxID=1457250 RepID=A0A4D6HCT0_9EURY|nr:alkaline phosphatase family protein [Halapricum salinum]QCC51779.1 nucleotide pyrophosphatase [Halapricum salinum]